MTNPAAIVAAVNAGLALVEELLPLVRDLTAKGEVSAADQAELARRFESLRTRASGEFSGAAWQIDPS